MQLLADVCDVDVVLPASVGDAVARGAAILGRFAAEEVEIGKKRAEDGVEGRGERLWEIMVRNYVTFICTNFLVTNRGGKTNIGRDDPTWNSCKTCSIAKGETAA